MNFFNLYSYHDYEEAYYKGQFVNCKKIGLYLLSKLSDKRSKQLYRQLENFEYKWETFGKAEQDLLSQVKIWLMVNSYF